MNHQSIAIIKSCGNNLTSLQAALNRLGYHSKITDRATDIQTATHVILPGVGHAQQAIHQLQKKQLDQLIPTLTQPVLGICLGMQLLFSYTEEGNVKGLNIIPKSIIALKASNHNRIPHMGWNQLQFTPTENPILSGIEPNSYAYFIHSYAAPEDQYTLATTCHSITFSSIVQSKNFYGMQFHPEKSGKVGTQLLDNFLNLGEKI